MGLSPISATIELALLNVFVRQSNSAVLNGDAFPWLSNHVTTITSKDFKHPDTPTGSVSPVIESANEKDAGVVELPL